MSFKSLGSGVSISSRAWAPELEEIFRPELLSLLSEFHKSFEPRRRELLSARESRQNEWNTGIEPQYLDRTSPAVTSEWKIKNIPLDYQTRRVEITGPVNDIKMVINMLSRNAEGDRADTAMLDFEDSMKPSFNNVIDGYKNVMGASVGKLKYIKEASEGSPEKAYQLDPDDMAGLMVRVRGLHLVENNFLVDNEPIHGGLLDLVVCFFHTAQNLLERGKTPKYYIPKTEHHLEARWWNDLFTALETKLKFKVPTLRATFLIETLPAAFQIEEILYEGREHIIALNVGRWDKIFSDIKVLRNHHNRISADRAEINMKKYWMDNYAKRLIKICHTRGAYAIGGMSAFTPGKEASVREAQTTKVRADKQYEADIGHDGCWVSHPYFIGHAMSAFKKTNQLDMKLDHVEKYPDLLMDGNGPRTISGLRTNIRVGIAYMQGWQNDNGCVAWDNLMEDLATLEISRAQTWQWLHHGVVLADGQKVTKELVAKTFEEEFEKICIEIQNNMKRSTPADVEKTIGDFKKAKESAQTIFLEEQLRNFLSNGSDLYN